MDAGVSNRRACFRRCYQVRNCNQAWPGQLLLVLALFTGNITHSSEVSAYLPVNLAPGLEARVEHLLLLANRAVMARPIRVATVLAALPAACRVDAVLCAQVRRDLAPWLRDAALTYASAQLAGSQAADSIQPNQHSAPMDAHWQASLGGYLGLGQHVLLNAGAVAYPGRVNPSGSFVSVGNAHAQIDLGFRDHNWSPMKESSMMVGTEAATMPSITLSNTAPLTRWGIQYEIFQARMSYSERIAWQGGYTSGNPLLAGFRMSVEPVPGWSLATSRLMQYGGGARCGCTLHDFFNAFVHTTRYENTSGQLSKDQDFGNQQVAFSSELQVPTRHPLSLYIEYAAEDTFHAENYRFGSSALSGGFWLPELRPNLQLRYEFSEWQSNWYVHHIYQDGLSNYGVVLGNWGAEWRLRGDGVGGQSHFLDLRWQLERGDDLNASYRTLQNAPGSGIDYRRAHELSLQWTRPWNALEIGAQFDIGRDVYGTTFGRLSALARLDGDLRVRSRGATLAGSAATPENAELRTSRYERFVDGGLGLTHLSYEQDADAVPAVNSFHGSAHVGVGVRRLGDAHSDFGVRMDLDNISGRLFTGLRALDYRYRFGSSLAVTGFIGAARYAALTPAYGWYLGLGGQWRNIFPGWDAGVDLRLGDHLVRNKLPGEAVIIWPNEFYKIKGEVFYLSRRF